MLIAFVWFVVHLSMAWLTAQLAQRRGYSGGMWFFISLPLPGIAALILLCLPEVKDVSADSKTQKLWSRIGNVIGIALALLLSAKAKKS